MKTEIINPRIWKRALTTNSTATSFASKVPTVTEPSGEGVHNVGGDEYVEFIPFGTDGDNDTFSLRIIGWRQHRGSVGNDLWIPNVLSETSVVLGTSTGVAGAEVVNTEFFGDTIALVSNGGTLTIVSQTAGNTVAMGRVPIAGYDKIEFTFDLAGAQEAVSMNALFLTY